MMMSFSLLGVVLLPLYFAIPTLILYFTVKFAVKNAIKELREDNTL